MTCATALDLMLEADPAELTKGGETELSRHLQVCATCRAAADRILAAVGALRTALAAATPRRPSTDAIRVAGRRQTAARRMRRALPLVAAAGLAWFVMMRREPSGEVPAIAPVRRPPPSITVTAPSGRSVAVLQTDRPDIVVFWFF